MSVYFGACHCRSIRVELHSDKPPERLAARACQCSFCRLHGASWTSDIEGQLRIEVDRAIGSPYRFGSGSAAFWVCQRCGVTSAVTWESPEGLLGVVRVECLEKRDSLLAHLKQTDFDAENLSTRFTRRLRTWTPARYVR